MVIRIPVNARRDLAADPWMTLGEAVRWAAWRGDSEPAYGSVELEDGSWISHGDMDEGDRRVYVSGAEQVRIALAAGELEAWAQTGGDEPIQLSKARWSAQMLGAIVSWVEFYHPFDQIIVERGKVYSLWPKRAAKLRGSKADHSVSVCKQTVSVRDAIRELHQCVKAAVPDTDPAPWFDVSQALIETFSEGDEGAFVRRKKMEERSMLVLQRGLLAGELQAHFIDGLESRDVPGWAWAGAERNDHVWYEGRLPLEVFLPNEWQRWSCHSVYLNRDAFTTWLGSQSLHVPGELPALPPPYDAQSKPALVKKRLPQDAPFVSLSEALTWIAFSFALDRDSLDRAISGNAFDATDPQAALSDAMAKLAVRASGGQLAARGKYVESHSTDENKVLTAAIDPVRFEDFAQFDILYDGLRYGTGLTWNKGGSALERALQDRRDAFRLVKINRADLLKLFPDKHDTAQAFFVPLPAALPEIGTVMPLDEALSWLAHGKPSHDIEIWQNAAGDLIFRDPSGAVIEPRTDGSPPSVMETYRQASRTLHGALRDGSLPAYVAPTNGSPLLVPRFYWNGVSPENLHHVYRGMTPDDHGAGCPVLLSRVAFDGWRAAIPPIKVPDKPRPTHDDVVGWCKHWIESGNGNGMDKAWRNFQSQPEHVGLSRDDVFRPAWREAKMR